MPFDAALADRAEAFFPNYLTHVDGEWAGKPFRPMEYQRKIIRHVFGNVDDSGRRTTRFVYLEVPRKQGKSTLAAGLALRQLVADREVGAQVYIAAADKEQAGIIYRICERMVKANPELSGILELNPSRKRILFQQRGSFLAVLGGEGFRAHGISASCIIFDELHVQRTRHLYEALRTSMGARRQPLFVMLTTAGFDRNTLCGEEHDYAMKIREGVIEEPTYLPVVYAADPKDNWKDPATWAKANPAWDELGETFQRGIAEAAKRAEDDPASLNQFLRLHLNIWTRQDVRYIPMDAWDATAGYSVSMDKLRGRRCYMGLDMANTEDIAALVLLFLPENESDDFVVLPRFWIPEDSIPKRMRTARVPYGDWVAEGLIRATRGNVIDYKEIKKQILQDVASFDVLSLRYDPWNMGQMSIELNEEVRDKFAVPVPQSFQGMSAPTKELMRLILSRRLQHGGNKVLRWMADNVTVEQHSDGRVRPAKDKSREKIDGIVALCCALDGWLRDDSSAFMEGDGSLKVV